MKRFIKTFLLFGWLAVVAYPVLVIALSALPQKLRPNLITDVEPTGFTNLRFNEASDHESVDVVILGSSHAYRGFDPRIFEAQNIKMFNLGTTAQTPLQSELILEQFVGQLNPKLIILEVYPWGFTSDGVESSIDLVFYGSPIGRGKLLQTTLDVNVLNSAIYASIHGSRREQIKSKRDMYIPGGYVERDMSLLKTINQPTRSWKWNEDQFEALDRIVKTCIDRNLNLLLIQAPTSKAFYSSFSNNKEFEGRMSEYGEYYNFNGLNSLSDSLHFYDEDHLNQDGVFLFNQALLDTLFDKGHLK